MHGALHPKSDFDRVHLSREMGGRGLISCEGCIRMEENNLSWYDRNSNEPLIEGVKATEIIEYNDIVNKKEFKQIWTRENKEPWKNKSIYVVSCKRNARNNRRKRNMVLAKKS